MKKKPKKTDKEEESTIRYGKTDPEKKKRIGPKTPLLPKSKRGH